MSETSTPSTDLGAAELIEAHARVAVLENERASFVAQLGFTHDGPGPVPLSDLVDPLADALAAADDHAECPRLCEPCGERLAATRCPECQGSGCGPGTALGAYAECETCAGVGWVHDGCAEKEYAELAARVAELEAQIARVREVHQPIEALNIRHRPNGRLTTVCSGCGTDDGNWQVYPCPTIRALKDPR